MDYDERRGGQPEHVTPLSVDDRPTSKFSSEHVRRIRRAISQMLQLAAKASYDEDDNRLDHWEAERVNGVDRVTAVRQHRGGTIEEPVAAPLMCNVVGHIAAWGPPAAEAVAILLSDIVDGGDVEAAALRLAAIFMNEEPRLPIIHNQTRSSPPPNTRPYRRMSDPGDEHITTANGYRQVWRHVGWIGQSGAFYSLDEPVREHERGSYAPLCFQAHSDRLEDLEPDSTQDLPASAADRLRATRDRHAARGSRGGEYLDADVTKVLGERGEALRLLKKFVDYLSSSCEIDNRGECKVHPDDPSPCHAAVRAFLAQTGAQA